MESFEYAIRKDVRNNPIVREVDAERQRQLWKSVGVTVFLVLVLLFSAWQHFELLRHGYQAEEMQRQRATEEEAGRRLRLEIETLKSPKRIEALATRQLHLVTPSGDEASVIERVLPVDPPAATVVALRR
jgi:cell division protein FtsL